MALSGPHTWMKSFIIILLFMKDLLNTDFVKGNPLIVLKKGSLRMHELIS